MNNKPKLFISMPMYGKTTDQIRSEMKKLYAPFKNQYDLIDTVFDIPGDFRTYFLGKSIELLDEADLVLFSKNWEEASGCRIERMVCALYNIPYIEEDLN